MFSFGYSFFLSGPIIGYTSLSYFYIFSIVFYMIHYFDTIGVASLQKKRRLFNLFLHTKLLIYKFMTTEI